MLYTDQRRNVPCYIEPYTDQFDKCSFNPNHETKFLIHGYVAILAPDDRFNDIKKVLLDYGSYNVIIVNWTMYNNFPFVLAYRNARIVGIKVAEFMKFTVNHARASPETFHCIGHSLGSHVCGQAGRLTSNLGRITGLDPGGISKFLRLKPNIRLRYKDANYVDVIHTSDIFSGTGLGYLDALGHMDFYPNGGVEQPHCQKGRRYQLNTVKNLTIQTSIDEGLCNHYIVLSYFKYSIMNNCRFIATKCGNFLSYKQNQCSPFDHPITAEMGFRIQTSIDEGLCNHYIVLSYFKYSIMNNCRFIATKCGNFLSYKQNQCSPFDHPITAEMGFRSKKMTGLPPKSKFFLETLEFPPYCKGKK
ncbi:unnamed protein product [Larinioides sclopetarius]|uniref:Lipase domain-containing protein n=1 Tax=Larinioides sclopetarius TaxID=280406 RepID=A0AAV2B0Y0_9ARAC